MRRLERGPSLTQMSTGVSVICVSREVFIAIKQSEQLKGFPGTCCDKATVIQATGHLRTTIVISDRLNNTQATMQPTQDHQIHLQFKVGIMSLLLQISPVCCLYSTHRIQHLLWWTFQRFLEKQPQYTVIMNRGRPRGLQRATVFAICLKRIVTALVDGKSHGSYHTQRPRSDSPVESGNKFEEMHIIWNLVFCHSINFRSSS